MKTTEWQVLPDFTSDGQSIVESGRVETRMPPAPWTRCWLRLQFTSYYIANVSSGGGVASFRWLGFPFQDYPLSPSIQGANFTNVSVFKANRDGEVTDQMWPVPYYKDSPADAYMLAAGGMSHEYTAIRFQWVYE